MDVPGTISNVAKLPESEFLKVIPTYIQNTWTFTSDHLYTFTDSSLKIFYNIKISISASQKAHCVCVTKINGLMLFTIQEHIKNI